MRGVETLKVMSPYLPDDERAERLARLREGEQELTDAEKRVLETANALVQKGKKATVRAVYERAGGNYAKTAAILKRLEQFQLISGFTEAVDEDGNA